MNKDVMALVKLLGFMVLFGVLLCVPPLIAVEVLEWVR